MYLLDANVLIEAARTYYSSKIAPRFWTWLADQHSAGNVASIEKVRQEIDDGTGGDLKTWAAGLPVSFWIKPSQPSVAAMTAVTAWAMDSARSYSTAARQTFLQAADYFLVAEALGGGHTVVTREKSSPESKRRVLIPDACDAVGVSCAEPFKVYEQLGLLFL